VRHAHPYDEVAFDVFPVHDADPKTGLGMIGTLPLKTDLRSFCHDVRSACGAAFASFAGDAKKAVKKVAILTGSAGSTAACVTKNVADVLVTGELSYHHAIDAVERGIGVVAVGHAASERIFAPKFCEWLQTDMDLSKHPLELIPYTEFPEPWNVVVGSVRKKHLTKKKSKTR